jgi:hypothetical protein
MKGCPSFSAELVLDHLVYVWKSRNSGEGCGGAEIVKVGVMPCLKFSLKWRPMFSGAALPWNCWIGLS